MPIPARAFCINAIVSEERSLWHVIMSSYEELATELWWVRFAQCWLEPVHAGLGRAGPGGTEAKPLKGLNLYNVGLASSWLRLCDEVATQSKKEFLSFIQDEWDSNSLCLKTLTKTMASLPLIMPTSVCSWTWTQNLSNVRNFFFRTMVFADGLKCYLNEIVEACEQNFCHKSTSLQEPVHGVNVPHKNLPKLERVVFAALVERGHNAKLQSLKSC